MKILFVCTGNISRSYLAETLLKHEINAAGVSGIEVSSAGTFGLTGHSADPEMIRYIRDNGIEPEEHSARQIDKEHVEWADLILVMEGIHSSYITSRWPQINNKIEKLGKYISFDSSEDDIIDPYGRSSYHYRLAQSQIALAIHNLTKKLVTDSVKD